MREISETVIEYEDIDLIEKMEDKKMVNREYMDLPSSWTKNSEKLRTKIDYWQTRFNMIKETTIAVEYKIKIHQEITDEIKSLKRKMSISKQRRIFLIME